MEARKLQIGSYVEGATHLVGRTRLGLPSPRCSSCGTEMFCMASLDTTDAKLRGTPVDGIPVCDLFVCAFCSVHSRSYYMEVTAGGARMLPASAREPAFGVPALPYPRYRIDVVAFPGAPYSRDQLGSMYGRSFLDGRFHLVTDAPLWGNTDQLEKVCNRCGHAVSIIATIDSDDSLDLAEALPDGTRVPLSLNWIDDYYLMVTHCRSCGLFGYHPAH